MTGPGGEMPFLEHLEELRSRLIRVVLALIAGVVIGFWVVQRFELVTLLAEPIAPFLQVTGGKLTVTSPTEPVMIVLKLALIVGLVLVSPFVIFEIWAFLSPALYRQERRVVIPALLAGTLLFIGGAAFGYAVLLPKSLPILFSFQTGGLAILITYERYFSFVLQLVLAMGLCFEIPLVMMMLTAFGVITPTGLMRFRRYAIVLSCAGGAVLSPGTDVLSMILMTVPILLLYEVGFAGAWLIHRGRMRRATAAALVVLIAGLLPGRADAQQPVPPTRPRPPVTRGPPAGLDSLPGAPGDTGQADSTARRPNQAVDTATARRLGLPTAPRHEFTPDDSVVTGLLGREGYSSTRFRSDSATLFADEKRIFLTGDAMTRRGETTLEADSIAYQENDCLIRARGAPALFDRETVLSGFGGIRYNTCIRRGVVSDALTSFKQGATDWFVRGNLAQDSSSARLFASSGEITSCDLPEPHYHFQASEVKWIAKTIMVARPAVLYVRDVPVLWLPFVFQDGRSGRRSGILIPRFGLNDIVRQNPGYNRQITNVGYYWAPNDYLDLTARLDWFSNRYLQYGVSGQYRWLDRSVSGDIRTNRLAETGGSSSFNLAWAHRQNFNLTTSLNLNIQYSSSSRVVTQNAVDPLLTTQQILSSANFSKRYPWGNVSLGGNRRQSIRDKSSTTQFPSLSISPKPLDLGPNVTWSPGLSVTNDWASNQPGGTLVRTLPTGLLDTVDLTTDRRTTAVSLDTPLRLGGFNWRNAFSFSDQQLDGRSVVTSKVPDLSTADPTDSVSVTQVYPGDFSSSLNWDTGINLPTLFRGSWKLQPGVGIVNSTSGAFMIRNRSTNGAWVRQGKRFNFTVSSSPTFFGFFGGFGPVARIRHSISPTFSYSFSPAASVDKEYARAAAGAGQTPVFRSDPTQTLSFGLSQNIEGKARRAPDDTSALDNSRKYRILGIQTSPVQYDFEQAKKPGRTGWRTESISNQLQSDLLPGFSLSLTHDLWNGPVGTTTARLDPFLSSVSASAAVSGNTVRGLLGIFGLSRRRTTADGKEAAPPSYVASQSRLGRPHNFYSTDQFLGETQGRRFTANFNYSLSRSRVERGAAAGAIASDARQSLGFSTGFSPTPFWTVSWSSQYNISDRKFESQVVRLERVLHEWRASFNFTRAPNGNFAFYFSVYLSDLPDIKFDYNQTSLDN